MSVDLPSMVIIRCCTSVSYEQRSNENISCNGNQKCNGTGTSSTPFGMVFQEDRERARLAIGAKSIPQGIQMLRAAGQYDLCNRLYVLPKRRNQIVHPWGDRASLRSWLRGVTAR